jgi:Flp pilus assembly protein TadG
MMRRATNRGRRRGAAMAEAAIVLSVFLTLVIGTIDLGLGVFYQQVVSHAARQGVRQAIVHGKNAPPKMTAWGPAPYSAAGDSGDAIPTAIRPYLSGLNPSNVTVQVNWIDGDNDLEKRVRVTVSTTWTPMLLGLLGGQKTLTASSTMPIAH